MLLPRDGLLGPGAPVRTSLKLVMTQTHSCSVGVRGKGVSPGKRDGGIRRVPWGARKHVLGSPALGHVLSPRTAPGPCRPRRPTVEWLHEPQTRLSLRSPQLSLAHPEGPREEPPSVRTWNVWHQPPARRPATKKGPWGLERATQVSTRDGRFPARLDWTTGPRSPASSWTCREGFRVLLTCLSGDRGKPGASPVSAASPNLSGS